jgi:hypothetical protein
MDRDGEIAIWKSIKILLVKKKKNPLLRHSYFKMVHNMDKYYTK